MNTVEGFGSFALLAHLHARKQSLKALTMKGGNCQSAVLETALELHYSTPSSLILLESQPSLKV